MQLVLLIGGGGGGGVGGVFHLIQFLVLLMGEGWVRWGEGAVGLRLVQLLVIETLPMEPVLLTREGGGGSI